LVLAVTLLGFGRSSYAVYDLTLSLHVEPPLQAHNFDETGENRVVLEKELFDKAKSILNRSFSIVQEFSPLNDTNYVLMLQLIHGNSFLGERGSDQYCIGLKYEANGEIRVCDEGIDEVLEDSIEEFFHLERKNLSKIAEKNRKINWFDLVDNKVVQVNNVRVPYSASSWQSSRQSFAQRLPTSALNRSFFDKSKYLISNYFTHRNGKSITFFKSTDLISIAMENPWSAKDHKGVIINLLGRVNKKSRMLPFYLKQAIKINAPREILNAFKSKRGSFDSYKDAEGNTPLFEAAVLSNENLFRFLIEEGSEHSLKNKLGLTPLHFACSSAPIKQSYSIIDFMQSKGADINYVSSDGVSCLASAISHNALNGSPTNGGGLVDEMVFRGAAINLSVLVADKAFSPLYSAVYYKDNSAAIRLVELGADVNQRPKDRESVLHLATQQLDRVLTHKLIGAGASLNALDSKNQTPLFYAFPNYKEEMTSKHMEMIKLLVSSGANQSLKNNSGLTAKESYVNARANYLEEQRQIAYNKRMQELRKQRMEEIAEARRERNRQRRAAQKRNGFQWGKFLAGVAGAAIGGAHKLDARTQAEFVTGLMKDSQAGVDGLSNSMSAFNNATNGFNASTYSSSNSDYSSGVPYMETVEWARQQGEEHKQEIERLNRDYGQMLSSSNITLGYDDGSAERARIAKLEAEQARRAEAQRIKNEDLARQSRIKHQEFLRQAERERKEREDALPDCAKPPTGPNPNPGKGSRAICL
ncbi:ankyrin repeat domain-containing protein, partial [Oleiphilus sp. HI0132]|uniref:ankyrin repeat domain-containing protein n=2 Tax=Oleiphilus sp. HI0132 TaxID=1822270 RepID=UPI0012E8F302